MTWVVEYGSGHTFFVTSKLEEEVVSRAIRDSGYNPVVRPLGPTDVCASPGWAKSAIWSHYFKRHRLEHHRAKHPQPPPIPEGLPLLRQK